MPDVLLKNSQNKRAVTALIAFVLAFDLAFTGQKLSGAYRSEFGGPSRGRSLHGGPVLEGPYPFIREGPVGGKRESFGAAKAEFASLWEAHYPRVERTAASPLFTALEAAWMLAFPATRGSLLILMAGLSAALATLLYLALRKEFGAVLAGLASALLVLIPMMRELTAMPTPDVLSAVLLFGFAFAVGELLDRKQSRSRVAGGRKLSNLWIAAGALLIAVALWAGIHVKGQRAALLAAGPSRGIYVCDSQAHAGW